MTISSILQYSTIDYRFLDVNLKQLSKFSSEIIVPICTSFFNGYAEDETKLKNSIDLINSYKNTKVILFDLTDINKQPRYYHNLSRKLGTDAATNEWILFVDADEIVSNEFLPWFETIKNTNNSYWFTCYWYFREPKYQAKQLEGAGLLTKKQYCIWNLDSNEERQQLFKFIPNFQNGDRGNVLSLSNVPLIHHFSWVRTKQEMLDKVKNWGHSTDGLSMTKNWIELVNKEFERDFNGTDFIHGYQYNLVDNIFNI